MKLREKIAMGALLVMMNALVANGQDLIVGSKQKPKGFGKNADVERAMLENGQQVLNISGENGQVARLVLDPTDDKKRKKLVSGSIFIPQEKAKGDYIQVAKIIEVAPAQNSELLSAKMVENVYDASGRKLSVRKEQILSVDNALQLIKDKVYNKPQLN